MDHTDVEEGVAGRSARRHYELSRERRALEARDRPLLVRLLRGLSAGEQRRVARERQWAVGARGEELVAESLARRCPALLLLHDRRMPHSRANIDHIAVGATGVYVIDTKRYSGRIEVRRPLFGTPSLRINGRDRCKLIEGLAKQVGVVKAALMDFAPDVPVRGCLCFVAAPGLRSDAGLPLLRTLRIEGYPLYHPRRLARRLNSAGPLSATRAREIHAQLAERLPAA
jgi:nuclease-like protein